MSVQRVDADEVVVRAVGMLGLDETVVDLFSVEGLCASLRRSASFLCPASPRQIVDSVLDALLPLKADLDRADVADALDLLVSSGDLLELRETAGRTRLLFLGPPSYVEKQPGEFLLLGIRPNAGPLLDESSLGAEVAYEAHTRTLTLDAGSAPEVLASAGLHRVTREQWAKAPRVESAAAVVEQTRDRLAAVRAPGQVSGLSIIDGAASIRFYKGRWREPLVTDSGIFVGRRPQAYGAPIWCAVEMEAGVPLAVLDLPADPSVAPGWDEGRRLQAALDSERGTAQVFRVGLSGQSGDARMIDFFAPLPSWAERYLDLAGLPVPKTRGSLFSYRVSVLAADDAVEFLTRSLWMTAIEEDQSL